MCLKEIGLCSIVNVIRAMINIIGGPVWPLNEHEIFTLTMNKKFVQGRYGIANHLALFECFISYEKWVQREKYPNNTRLPYSINSNKKTAGNGSYTNLRGRWARCSSILHLLSVGVLYPVHKGMLRYHQFMILELGLDSRLDNSIPLLDCGNQLCSRARLSIPAISESPNYKFLLHTLRKMRTSNR